MRLIALLLMIASLTTAEAAFLEDYSEAAKLAVMQNKPLLLFFSGSDWSGLSMKMKNEIFQAEDFTQKLQDQLICVEIDFPRHHQIDSNFARRGEVLKNRYQVEEFPSLVLIDPEGRLIAKLGYLPEQAAPLAEDLLYLLSQDQMLCQLHQNLDHLSHEELKEGYLLAIELQQHSTAEAFLTAGCGSKNPAFFLIEQYRQLLLSRKDGDVRQIRERLTALDPENREGYLFTLALIDFQARSNSSLTPAEVIKPLEEYLECFGPKDEENLWKVEMMIAQFYLEHDELYSALKHAEVALQVAPQERREEMTQSLRYIREHLLHE